MRITSNWSPSRDARPRPPRLLNRRSIELLSGPCELWLTTCTESAPCAASIAAARISLGSFCETPLSEEPQPKRAGRASSATSRAPGQAGLAFRRPRTLVSRARGLALLGLCLLGALALGLLLALGLSGTAFALVGLPGPIALLTQGKGFGSLVLSRG